MRTIHAGTETFDRALGRVRDAVLRAEFVVDEAPAPARLAPSAVALVAEPATDAEITASGRFVLLHDPDGVEEWHGEFRCVIFVRVDMDPEVGSDPLLPQVAWSWLVDALATVNVVEGSLGGTVTCATGMSFGSLTERPSETTVEVRASWTPAGADGRGPEEFMSDHVLAWGDVLALGAGLPPTTPGVSQVMHRRRNS